MEKRINIIPCGKCGEKGYLYMNMNDNPVQYYIKCEKCGQVSPIRSHWLEDVITSWNEMNRPSSKKPTYHCGNCGTEIYLGFSECPKCKTGIEW